MDEALRDTTPSGLLKQPDKHKFPLALLIRDGALGQTPALRTTSQRRATTLVLLQYAVSSTSLLELLHSPVSLSFLLFCSGTVDLPVRMQAPALRAGGQWTAYGHFLNCFCPRRGHL